MESSFEKKRRLVGDMFINKQEQEELLRFQEMFDNFSNAELAALLIDTDKEISHIKSVAFKSKDVDAGAKLNLIADFNDKISKILPDDAPNAAAYKAAISPNTPIAKIAHYETLIFKLTHDRAGKLLTGKASADALKIAQPLAVRALIIAIANEVTDSAAVTDSLDAISTSIQNTDTSNRVAKGFSRAIFGKAKPASLADETTQTLFREKRPELFNLVAEAKAKGISIFEMPILKSLLNKSFEPQEADQPDVHKIDAFLNGFYDKFHNTKAAKVRDGTPETVYENEDYNADEITAAPNYPPPPPPPPRVTSSPTSSKHRAESPPKAELSLQEMLLKRHAAIASQPIEKRSTMGHPAPTADKATLLKKAQEAGTNAPKELTNAFLSEKARTRNTDFSQFENKPKNEEKNDAPSANRFKTMAKGVLKKATNSTQEVKDQLNEAKGDVADNKPPRHPSPK